MEKTLEKNKQNNKKEEKLSKDQMIKQLEHEIEQLKIIYHQKTGALDVLKRID